MRLIDSAKSHFESLGVQHLEVEEWKDEAGNPSIIYWNPITLSEKNKLFKKSDNLNDVSILADILVMKALDKEGNKLFTLEDKLALMHKVDSYFSHERDGNSLLDILPDNNHSGPEEKNQEDDIKNNIIMWLQELTPKQREVLSRRFGLMGFEPDTLENVGAEIGLTRERVRQIQLEALRRLKDILGLQGLSLEVIFSQIEG